VPFGEDFEWFCSIGAEVFFVIAGACEDSNREDPLKKNFRHHQMILHRRLEEQMPLVCPAGIITNKHP